jgi:hypothetical protein
MRFTKYIITVIFAFCLSNNLHSQKTKNPKQIGNRKQTSNPNIPYIYVNDFRDYEVLKQLIVNKKDTSTVYTLKFNAVASAMYTQKVLFDKFGKWTTAVQAEDNRNYILIWKNIKLFDDKEELFTVAANGVESREEMFASVMVFDSKNNDCLSENNVYKNEIITLFKNCIHRLNNDNTFYTIYKEFIN